MICDENKLCFVHKFADFFVKKIPIRQRQRDFTFIVNGMAVFLQVLTILRPYPHSMGKISLETLMGLLQYLNYRRVIIIELYIR